MVRRVVQDASGEHCQRHRLWLVAWSSGQWFWLSMLVAARQSITATCDCSDVCRAVPFDGARALHNRLVPEYHGSDKHETKILGIRY
jgi:hypothetical protein